MSRLFVDAPVVVFVQHEQRLQLGDNSMAEQLRVHILELDLFQPLDDLSEGSGEFRLVLNELSRGFVPVSIHHRRATKLFEKGWRLTGLNDRIRSLVWCLVPLFRKEIVRWGSFRFFVRLFQKGRL